MGRNGAGQNLLIAQLAERVLETPRVRTDSGRRCACVDAADHLEDEHQFLAKPADRAPAA